MYGADRGYLRTLIPGIQAVTPADILRVHALYLRSDRRVIILVGDATQIEPQLRDWVRVVRE